MAKTAAVAEQLTNPEADFLAFIDTVRNALLRRDLRAAWVEELLTSDEPYLRKAFELKEHPAAAALEIFTTEEEFAQNPLDPDHRIKFELSEQAHMHLQHLVDLGLWGSSIDQVCQSLVEQSLAAKLASGLLRTSYHRQETQSIQHVPPAREWRGVFQHRMRAGQVAAIQPCASQQGLWRL